MTGTELSAALAEKLKALLPDCAVRPAFTGTLQRLPQRAAVTVGVMQEENADGVFETVLGVQSCMRAKGTTTRGCLTRCVRRYRLCRVRCAV